MDESEVEEVMRRVLLSGRLSPGTKLGETKLASIFGVSRERVRGVLKRLSHDRMVQIEKNRGAFVMPVDLNDARATYEARRHTRKRHCDAVGRMHRTRRYCPAAAASRRGDPPEGHA